MDEINYANYLPTAFGGSGSGFDIEAQIEKTRRIITANKNSPPTKKSASKGAQQDNDDDDDDNNESSNPDTDSDSDSDSDTDEYPITHSITFPTHSKAVTTITCDPSGSRLITGSMDCTLKLHDFASMTPNTIRAFKSVDPTSTKPSSSAAASNTEIHPIHTAQFHPQSGSSVLVVNATPQARILSRDGDLEVEFPKGDMYLRDMNMTKGHVSELTAGMWHPFNYDLCVTAGTDSTLRIWDVNNRMKQRDIIVHKSKAAGSAGRSRMTAVAWGSHAVDNSGNSSSLLVAAALDGSLLMWGGDGPYNRPAGEIRDAHVPDTWTGGIDISSDGRLVVTRGGDDMIKLWDTRKFKSPVNTTSHPSTSAQYPTSNVIFSPNATAILAGSPSGDLHILNPATLKPEVVTPITPSSPLITVNWHPKLNQILAGSANSTTHILFSPKTSQKGALSILSKAPKRRHVDDDPNFTTDLSEAALAGDALTSQTGQPLPATSSSKATGLTASGKSRDPRRPHLPATTPFSKNAPDEKHIKNSIPLSTMREEDPREALLKYADKAVHDPIFTKAWSKTQPKTIYAAAEEDDDDAEGPEAKRVKR